MGDDDYMKALEIQRRNFEKQFGNLEDMGFVDKSKDVEALSDEDVQNSDSEDESGSEDDEAGEDDGEVSQSESEPESEESEDDVKPKVVRLEDNHIPTQASKADKKLLRKGRAPTLAELENAKRKRRNSRGNNRPRRPRKIQKTWTMISSFSDSSASPTFSHTTWSTLVLI